MAERRNTRLAGHALRSEGKPCEPVPGGGWCRRRGWLGRALCECGERSPDLGTDGARKRWHAEHKQAVREQLSEVAR